MIRSADSAVERRTVVNAMLRARREVSEPAFVLVGVLGLLTAVAHPDESIFTRLWVQLAIPLWLFAVMVVWLVQRPLAAKVASAAKALSNSESASGDGAKEFSRLAKWLTRVTWISWLGLVGMVVLMVTQPA